MGRIEKLNQMLNESTLTMNDKIKIKKDFIEWSGGFAPEESDLKDQKIYIKTALSAEYVGKEKEIRAWFAEITED